MKERDFCIKKELLLVKYTNLIFQTFKKIYIYIFVSLNLQFSKYIVPNSREKGSSKRGTAGVSTYYLDEEKIF